MFAGLIGYEDTVMPQIANAILSKHNFILLGLRGQAKSRILRGLVSLMDDALPIVAGSEINDNPFAPISKYARNLINEAGEDTPIAWVGRENRYVEKLATPDVTIADLIGDLDPIRAARGACAVRRADDSLRHAAAGESRHLCAERVAGSRRQSAGRPVQRHAGGDVQIKGYPFACRSTSYCASRQTRKTTRRAVRSSRHSKIASAARSTHCPATVDLGMDITKQEAWTQRDTYDPSASRTSSPRSSSASRSRRAATGASTSDPACRSACRSR